jgi:hypothetical protein
VSFLVPGAPSHLLRPGETLELFEGDRKVAEASLLGGTGVP